MNSVSPSTNEHLNHNKAQSETKDERLPEGDQKEKPRITADGDIKILKTVYVSRPWPTVEAHLCSLCFEFRDLKCPGLCCKFSETGEKLAVGLTNGDIQIYRGSTGSSICRLSDEHTKADRLPVTSVNFIPARLSDRGELLVATYASGTIKFWHIATGTAVQTIHENFQLLTSSLAPSASQLVAAGNSEEILVYDVKSGKKINTCCPSQNRSEMDGHRFRICAVKHHPEEDNIFLSGGWDDTMQIWDQREEHAVRRIFGPHICGDGIDFDVKQGTILTASWRKNDALQVWDYNTGNRIKTIPADFSCDSLLYCGQWLGKDSVLCGGSDSHMIRVVEKTAMLSSGIITGLPSGVYSVDHDRHRLSHHHHALNDITMITAVAGNNLYFMSNAPVKRDKAAADGQTQKSQ